VNVVPLKYVVQLNPDVLPEETPPDYEFDYIDIASVDRQNGITRVQHLGFGDAPSRARRIVKAGDVIVSTVRTYLRAVASIGRDHDGHVCSTGFAVLRATDRINPRFLHYAVIDPRFVDEVVARSTGVSYPAIAPTDLAQIPISTPPLREQAVIAGFLDRECSRIDALRAELDGAQTAADSAYSDALRQLVFEGWYPLVPLKHYASTGTGHTPSRQQPEYWIEEECVIAWFTLADVNQIRDGRREFVAETTEKVSERGLANSSAVLHPAGTVILSRTASVGFSAVMGVDMAVSQDFMTWTCGPKVEPRYLLAALRAMQPELRGLMHGSTHQTIYMPDLHALRIPLPPLDRQREIVDKASRVRSSTWPLVDEINATGDLLVEYRDALLTEAVVGQLDVARLSDRQMDENLDAVLHGHESELLAG
jgi:type I restriction enzyme S subunit